jgi:hypothetical protein
MIQYLNRHVEDLGYLFVALPKSDLLPLALLTEFKGSLQEYDGQLLDLFEPDETGLPLKERELPAFSGQQLIRTDWSLGANLLSGILKLLKPGGNKLQANLSGLSDLKVSFAYENVEEERVSEQALNDFLVGAIPKKKGFQRSIERLKDGELFVLTSVLRSNKFSVSLDHASENKGKVEAAVNEIIDAHAEVERKSGNSFSIQTDKGQSFVFACRAAQVLYDKKHWFEFWKKEDARFRIEKRDGMIVRGEEDFAIQPLQTDTMLLDF